MDTKLRILTLSLVSLLAVSCSSDDNAPSKEGKTKDIVFVLSQEEKVYVVNDNKETLESTRTLKYNYNKHNLITSSTLNIPYGEVNIGDNIGDTNWLYNEKQQLIALEYKGQKQKEFFYENDLLMKTIDHDDADLLVNVFKYDSNKRVQEKHRNSYKKKDNSTEGSTEITVYQYNTDGLIEKVIDGNSKEVSAEITYDKEKTLFTNMITNNQLQNIEYFYEIDIIYKPFHNIKVIKDNYNEYSTIYEFDKTGYPIKETTTEKNLQSGKIDRKTIFTYTYKIVTVKQ